MSAFIFVQQGELTRFGEQEQEILGYLHQWTNGKFWNRLIILDRASFNYNSMVERSKKDKSYWFESQTTAVKSFQRLVLDIGKKEGWTVKRKNEETPLRLSDLQGIKRLPFDASQTLFCDQTRPGCEPVNSRRCRNSEFGKACHQMPIWEDEAPVDARDFDQTQNDDDFYHEYQYDDGKISNVLFWEDLGISKTSKYFFYEQLKILTRYIKSGNPKIRTNREVFKREVNEWNVSYQKLFISKVIDIKECSKPRAEKIQRLKKSAKCNRWGNWITEDECLKCGDGFQRAHRYCYNHDKSGY